MIRLPLQVVNLRENAFLFEFRDLEFCVRITIPFFLSLNRYKNKVCDNKQTFCNNNNNNNEIG